MNRKQAHAPTITAPDGTDVEVSRNHGKPVAAANLAKRGRTREGSNPEPLFPPTVASEVAPAFPPVMASEVARAFPATVKGPPRARVAARAPKASAPPADQVDSAPAAEASHDAGVAVAPPPPNPKRSMQVRFTGMKPMHIVEAALFSAGKPVAVEEIAESTGLPPASVKAGIQALQKAYAERDTVLEVGKAGLKWGMQVKQQAAEPAAKFAPMEIPAKVLKTLALIAYHQPLKQSELADMIGSKVYDHVPELVQRGLVKAREEGVTKILVTTSLFPEYFGLDASDPQEIRATMARLVGIDPSRSPEPVAAAPPAPAPVTAGKEPDTSPTTTADSASTPPADAGKQ